MIALCAMHHDQAHAWTVGQVREMKMATGGRDARTIEGRFQWMRNALLGAVGGNYYFETPQLIVIGGRPVVWFNRDEAGLLRLNVRIVSLSGRQRLEIEDNDWISRGDDLVDLQSPPSGDKLIAKYANGDYLAIKFRELSSVESLMRVHPTFPGDVQLEFPLVSVSVTMRIQDTRIDLSPYQSTFSDRIQLCGCYSSHNPIGINIGM